MNALEALFQDSTAAPVSAVRWLDRNVPFDENQTGAPLNTTLTPPNTFIVLPEGQRVKVHSLDVQYVHSSRALNFSFDAMDLVKGVLEDFNTKTIDHTLHHGPKSST